MQKKKISPADADKKDYAEAAKTLKRVRQRNMCCLKYVEVLRAKEYNLLVMDCIDSGNGLSHPLKTEHDNEMRVVIVKDLPLVAILITGI